jgi:hypothetical protein
MKDSRWVPRAGSLLGGSAMWLVGEALTSDNRSTELPSNAQAK